MNMTKRLVFLKLQHVIFAVNVMLMNGSILSLN